MRHSIIVWEDVRVNFREFSSDLMLETFVLSMMVVFVGDPSSNRMNNGGIERVVGDVFGDFVLDFLDGDAVGAVGEDGGVVIVKESNVDLLSGEVSVRAGGESIGEGGNSDVTKVEGVL